MDATCVVSRAERALQLFVIHYLYNNAVFPVLCSIMKRKKITTSYKILLNLRDEVLQNRAVASIMTDYECANVFSKRGCWFHFNKAVFTQVR
ncbi:hypothetical protein RN001_012004 [Aquatica leii]|uniref:MULE transposase domain-containing protein n=1 Tax=Aquatica leii TaxID=1421715 RepID=A0AAN7SD38_9COLE|nr:hypothetical protein RN001_012004 [Aquatica leii]